MKIAVFGLGYVGCVSAACLADMGHTVIGVDVDDHKVALVQAGRSPIVERGLETLLAEAVAGGRLRATTDVDLAVRESDVSLVCVGTPSLPNGSLDSTFVTRVIEQIGAALGRGDRYHVVVVRSTLLPGILQQRIVPALQAASGRTLGAALGLCVNPEFLREGSALDDFRNPPFTLIGQHDARSGDLLAAVYQPLSAPVYRIPADAAAMVKYASNAFHALKVVFANEIGVLCGALGVDGGQVMDVFCRDTVLNISKAYLRPGFAFGGSCLPKDLRALLYSAKVHDTDLPLLASVIPSNDLQIRRVVDLVSRGGRRKVALLGLSFKPGTDDLRESPLVRLAEALIGKGFPLAIYDRDVSLSNVFGRNREYIERMLPHVSQLLDTDLAAVLARADVVIVGKRLLDTDGAGLRLRDDQDVVDLTGLAQFQPSTRLAVA